MAYNVGARLGAFCMGVLMAVSDLRVYFFISHSLDLTNVNVIASLSFI